MWSQPSQWDTDVDLCQAVKIPGMLAARLSGRDLDEPEA